MTLKEALKQLEALGIYRDYPVYIDVHRIAGWMK